MCGPVGMLSHLCNGWEKEYGQSRAVDGFKAASIANSIDGRFRVRHVPLDGNEDEDLLREKVRKAIEGIGKENYYGVYMLWPEDRRKAMMKKGKEFYRNAWECITDEVYNITGLCICATIHNGGSNYCAFIIVDGNGISREEVFRYPKPPHESTRFGIATNSGRDGILGIQSQ